MFNKNDLLYLTCVEDKYILPVALVIDASPDKDIVGYYLDLLIDGLVLHAFVMQTEMNNEDGFYGFFVCDDEFWRQITFKMEKQ